MDINIINQAIQDLENTEINSAVIKELAALYIIRDKYNYSNTTDPDQSDVDILPSYRRYQTIKRKFQLGEISEDALVPNMKLIMEELEEFLLLLYTNTYLRKERLCIEQTISNITNKLSNI